VQELPRCVKVILDKENGTMNKQQQHELVQKAQLAGMGFTVFIRSTITSTEQRPSQQCRHTMPCANKVSFLMQLAQQVAVAVLLPRENLYTVAVLILGKICTRLSGSGTGLQLAIASLLLLLLLVLIVRVVLVAGCSLSSFSCCCYCCSSS
jgi:hypothetical protein